MQTIELCASVSVSVASLICKWSLIDYNSPLKSSLEDCSGHLKSELKTRTAQPKGLQKIISQLNFLSLGMRNFSLLG